MKPAYGAFVIHELGRVTLHLSDFLYSIEEIRIWLLDETGSQFLHYDMTGVNGAQTFTHAEKPYSAYLDELLIADKAIPGRYVEWIMNGRSIGLHESMIREILLSIQQCLEIANGELFYLLLMPDKWYVGANDDITNDYKARLAYANKRHVRTCYPVNGK